MILEVMGNLLFPLALVDPLYPSAWFKVAYQSVAQEDLLYPVAE